MFYSFRKKSSQSLRAPSLVDELLNEIYSRFSSVNGETTSDMSSPYHYGSADFGARGDPKFGTSRYEYIKNES